MTNSIRLACAALLLFSLLGCSESNQPAQEHVATADAPAPTEPAPAAPAEQIEVLPSNQGRIVTHVSIPGYSYLEVENGGERIWIAGNPVQFQEGQVIAWGQAAMMPNFYSKALDRTFDAILFVSDIYNPATQAGAAGGNRDSQGKVQSVNNVAGYSYLEVEMEGHITFWLAVPETQVNVGDTISWQGGSMMRNFSSKSLNRTFEEILFASGINVVN